MLNAHMFVRWKRNEASGPKIGERRRRSEMFVIDSVVSGRDVSYVLIGNQVRLSLRAWVSPPDPSTNHNIATDIHHGGTAQWFFERSMFGQWKSTGSLLWIYGKRTFIQLFNNRLLITLYVFSGIGKDNPLVNHHSSSTHR